MANNNEIWQLGGAGYAYGQFVIFAGSINVSGYAYGSISASQVQTDLEVIYGSGNVDVTADGDGNLTIEFVGDLTGTAITDTPWLDTSGIVSGSASLSQIAGGVAGVHEVQTIALPSNLVGGTWQIGIGSWLAWDASASAVETYLEALLSQSLTVSGGSGSFTVTWSDFGPQDLLDVESIDLQVRNTATIATTQTGGAFGLIAHFVYDAFGNVKSVTNGSGNAIEDGATVTSITYAGYTYDWNTETYVTINRIYDPKTGEWFSPDPIQIASGQSNFYVYAGNDPINGWDPSGLVDANLPHDHHILPQRFRDKFIEIFGAGFDVDNFTAKALGSVHRTTPTQLANSVRDRGETLVRGGLFNVQWQELFTRPEFLNASPQSQKKMAVETALRLAEEHGIKLTEMVRYHTVQNAKNVAASLAQFLQLAADNGVDLKKHGNQVRSIASALADTPEGRLALVNVASKLTPPGKKLLANATKDLLVNEVKDALGHEVQRQAGKRIGKELAKGIAKTVISKSPLALVFLLTGGAQEARADFNERGAGFAVANQMFPAKLFEEVYGAAAHSISDWIADDVFKMQDVIDRRAKKLEDALKIKP